MKTLGTHNYYVYILTNKNKTVLYTGVTNELKNRLYWHRNPELSIRPHFTFKYKCFYLIYYEHFNEIEQAIVREKQIKGYSRTKKEAIINGFNPEWEFLNSKIYFRFIAPQCFALNDRHIPCHPDDREGSQDYLDPSLR